MKFPIIGGVIFAISGVAALAAVALNNSNDAPAAVTAAPSAAAPGDSLVLSVPDMHCEFACAPKVRETLAAVPGVEEVQTNVENQTATLVIGDGFDEAKAIAALTAAGYPSERLAK